MVQTPSQRYNYLFRDGKADSPCFLLAGFKVLPSLKNRLRNPRGYSKINFPRMEKFSLRSPLILLSLFKDQCEFRYCLGGSQRFPPLYLSGGRFRLGSLGSQVRPLALAGILGRR